MPDRDWIIIFVLGIGWGSTFYFNEVLLRELGPVSVSFARIAVAAAVCWVWVAIRGRAGWPGWTTLGALSFMGFAMYALPFAIYPIGQQYVASGVAGIVNALTPVMTVIVSHLWVGGERATPLKSAGVAAGFLGIVLLTLPAMGDEDGTRLFGTLILVLAPVSYAVAMNFVRRFHAIHVDQMLTWSLTCGALMLLPVMLTVEGVPRLQTGHGWASLIFLGTVLTAISFLFAFRVLPRAGATKTSTVTFIAPISALLIGFVVLNEELGAAHVAGMAAIFAGLLLIDGRLFRRRAAA